ncbi:MAG TPA: sulfur carrier protein ThiS [Phycisphaerales bacterium]|nr:sulfur carrier protein ThiS [Phycisphaerales bacterium]HRQ74578.1 sulfur carrier protein ThiS [Phycisphaerales bacterium]
MNGEERTISEPCSVGQLLALCGLSAAPCAVEVNAALVPKRHHAEYMLADGDRVEVVTLVGGG